MSIDPRTLLALVGDSDLLDELRRRGVDLARLNDKPCAHCGALFSPNRGQRYCSDEHRQEAAKARGKTAALERSRRWVEKNRDAHNAYHRWYQRRYREQMTPEQKARHRAQKREWSRRKKAMAA